MMIKWIKTKDKEPEEQTIIIGLFMKKNHPRLTESQVFVGWKGYSSSLGSTKSWWFVCPATKQKIDIEHIRGKCDEDSVPPDYWINLSEITDKLIFPSTEKIESIKQQNFKNLDLD